MELVAMERTAVNLWTWSVEMGYNQGEIVAGHGRTLYCAGQTAMSGDGKPQHADDMAAQVAMSLDNLEAVLGEAGMSLANLVRLNIYTTDVDLLFEHFSALVSRTGAVGVAPPGTLLGVARLAYPELMVELIYSAVYVRLLFGYRTLDRGFAESIVAAAFEGISAADTKA